MNRPERLLILGGWGHHYLEALARDPGVTVGVTGDGFDDMATLRAANLPDAQWFDDPHDALSEFGADVVSIGGVYGRNGEWILAALDAGIPVVSDKPIASSFDQLHALEAVVTAEAAGGDEVPVLTELPLRCDAAMRTARQVVREGRIGEPVLAQAQKSYRFGAARPHWYADRDLYTGTVLWISTHGLDLLRYITGLEAEAVGGHGGNVSRPEYGSMEDHTVTVLALANGGSAVSHSDYLRPEGAPSHGDDRIRVAGSEGVLEVRDSRCWLIDASGGPTDITDDAPGLPVEEVLLAALAGDQSIFSTAESLATARLALAAREVTDRG